MKAFFGLKIQHGEGGSHLTGWILPDFWQNGQRVGGNMFVTWNGEPGSMQIEYASSVAVRYCPKQPHTALLGSFLHICPSLLLVFVRARWKVKSACKYLCPIRF